MSSSLPAPGPCAAFVAPPFDAHLTAPGLLHRSAQPTLCARRRHSLGLLTSSARPSRLPPGLLAPSQATLADRRAASTERGYRAVLPSRPRLGAARRARPSTHLCTRQLLACRLLVEVGADHQVRQLRHRRREALRLAPLQRRAHGCLDCAYHEQCSHRR